MKIGLMGGSFDPVHFGHLIAAQDAMEQHGLDRVVLVPAAQAPLKDYEVSASGQDRVAMVQAAIDWDQRFEVSDFEVTKGGVSYTIDTVRFFRARYAGARLFWIIGGDQVPKLGRWRDIDELAQMIEFIFLERPGHPSKTPPTVPGLRLHRCDGHLIELSSTELRDRMQKGLSLDYFMPHKTIEFIREKGLYR